MITLIQLAGVFARIFARGCRPLQFVSAPADQKELVTYSPTFNFQKASGWAGFIIGFIALIGFLLSGLAAYRVHEQEVALDGIAFGGAIMISIHANR